MKNRKRNRMIGYDYSRDNLYFVTFCVKDRKRCLVGAGRDLRVLPEVSGDLPVMKLNEYGIIVQDRILWLSNQYEYVKIHNYVVMPDHVHIIIEINSASASASASVGAGRDLRVLGDLRVLVGRDLRVEDKEIKIKSLSSLLGALKTTSSKLIHQNGFPDFAWQRSFHDRIIRSHQEYLRISKYIDLNPEKWQTK